MHPDHHHPWAIASFRTANYVLWPFVRTIVDKPTAARECRETGAAAAALLN